MPAVIGASTRGGMGLSVSKPFEGLSALCDQAVTSTS
jgi:hypothetical protein